MNPLWLLFTAATVGTKPSQAQTGMLAAHWAHRFFGTCVPTHMIGGTDLATFVPCPHATDGWICPQRIPSARTLLRRPGTPNGGMPVGTQCADVGSGMVESYGSADPRYALARKLGVHQSLVPTDRVAYSFAADVWLPALHERDDGSSAPVSMQYTKGGRFVLARPDGAPVDVTDPAGTGVGLGGRTSVRLRPLSTYNRPGIYSLPETLCV